MRAGKSHLINGLLWDRRWGIHFRGMDAVGDAVGERASDALADEDWSDPLKVVQIC